MKDREPLKDSPTRSYLAWLLIAGTLLLICIGFLYRRAHKDTGSSAEHVAASNVSVRLRPVTNSPRARAITELGHSAEEIVAAKVTQFARNRRKLAHDIAAKAQKDFPPEFERFFDAAEAGRIEEMQAIYKSLRQQRENGASESWYGPHWSALSETLGVVEAARDWPAQRLLDYGNSVLGALRPGMVYAGGTDSGRFIPTLLNETSDGDHHVILTQNALADGTYLEYVGSLYGDQLKTLSKQDSERAFSEYLKDAQQRFAHDQQFPDEPKQLRPGEDVRVTDNRVRVSGQVAVMSINEKLFQMLMQNNPGVSFAIEESFPFRSTYANATTLGPVMELGLQDDQSALSPARAAEAIDYWHATAQDLISDPNAGLETLKAYSKMVLSQAGLLQARNFPGEAEEAFRIANEICPSNPEAVSRYVSVLVDQQRVPDAINVVQNALVAAPNEKQFNELLNALQNKKP